MPPWATIFEKLAPEAQEFLTKATPLANERVGVLLKAAETKFAKQPEILKQINEAALPAATHFRALREGKPVGRVASDVFMDYLADTQQLSPGTVKAAEMAKTGAPNWMKSHLPVDLSPITGQAKIAELQDQLKRYHRPEDAKARAKIQGRLEQAVKAAQGQQAIKDMPRWLYLSPLSPVSKSDFVMGVKTRFPTDVAAAMMTQDANTKTLRAAWRATAGWFKNIGETRAFKRDMRDLYIDTMPLQERYYRMREQLVKMDKAIEKADKGGMPTAKKLADLQAAKKKFIDERLMPIYKDLQAKRHAGFSKYFDQPDVRIALYREPETRPWVEKLMTPEEIKVAEWHKQLMDNARASLTEAGIPTLKQDEEYITHLIHHITKGGKVKDAAVQAYIDRMLPQMVKFAHRTPGSMMFFPSVRTITDSYITGTSRKLAVTELLKKYQPIIEGPLKQWPRTQQYFTKYFKQYTEKLMDDQFFEKAFRGTTWWMYLSKTANSLSVGRKHAEKAIGLLATHPTDVARAIAPATRAGLELAFQKAGVAPGSEARLIRNYLSSRSFFEAMSGVTAPERERLTTMLNTLFAFPTNAIEMTERAIGIMTAVSKGTRKGLSHDQMSQAIWQILVDQSFIGKADRFLWLRQPWQQLLFLFAYTPGRITDTTIKRVLMSLPRKHIEALQADVIQTAWKFPTDVFGTPYVKNTLMFLGGIAAAEMFARQFDSSIWKEAAFHMSLLRERGGETELYFWPYDLYKEGEKRGGKLSNPMPFIQATLESFASFPQIERYLRTFRGEISPIYGGSAARQLTALPSVSAAERQGERFRGQREKQAAKAQKKATERFKQQSLPGSMINQLPESVRRFLGY